MTIYDQEREIVRYAHCFRRGQTFSGERFEKELLAQRPGAQRTQTQQRFVALVGPVADGYLRALVNTDGSMARQIRELLALVRQDGPEAVAAALEKAQAAGAIGADYVANILFQGQSAREQQPPLRLKDTYQNKLATDPLSLLEYDAFILSERSKP